MKIRPAMMTWSKADGTFTVDPRFLELCRRQYADGETVPMVQVEQRNMKSHNHYFARLHELWLNLPHELSTKYPTEDALRSKALVECDYFTEKDYVCDSPAKARALAVIIRAYASYSVIKVSGNIVKVFDPESQSLAAMGLQRFEESKKAVLDYCEALIPGGVDQRELTKAAERHAGPEKKAPRQVAGATPAKPAPTSAPPLPKSAAEYFAYARAWMGKMAADKTKTIDDAWARFEGERELRDELRVSIPNRGELENLIRSYFKENAQ